MAAASSLASRAQSAPCRASGTRRRKDRARSFPLRSHKDEPRHFFSFDRDGFSKHGQRSDPKALVPVGLTIHNELLLSLAMPRYSKDDVVVALEVAISAGGDAHGSQGARVAGLRFVDWNPRATPPSARMLLPPPRRGDNEPASPWNAALAFGESLVSCP